MPASISITLCTYDILSYHANKVIAPCFSEPTAPVFSDSEFSELLSDMNRVVLTLSWQVGSVVYGALSYRNKGALQLYT